jgi:MoxR-vWA-beta-propeller ternary system domain bpX4
MSQPSQPFLETLYHLRTVEHVILYNKLTVVPYKEEQDVIAFLEGEYERESTDYPFTPPPFSAAAALWAAKTVYFAAQLFLYRENKATELATLLPAYSGSIDASAMLSADLCLRFLPGVKYALEAVDVNDALLPVIEQHLLSFPYSGVGRDGEFTAPDTATISNNDCLMQLYLDRITEKKAANWANQPIINSAIRANMGNHKNDLWRELNN